jgi:hypothetical protein
VLISLVLMNLPLIQIEGSTITPPPETNLFQTMCEG